MDPAQKAMALRLRLQNQKIAVYDLRVMRKSFER